LQKLSKVAYLISAKELASYLGINEMTVYKHANSGALPGVRLGKLWRFDLDKIKDIVLQGDFLGIDVPREGTNNNPSVSEEDLTQALMDSLVPSMSEGLIVCRCDGEILLINPAAQSMLELLNRKITSLDEVERRLGELGAKDISLQNNGEESLRHEVNLKGLRSCFVVIEKNIVRNDYGEIMAMLIILRDITAERNVDQMKDNFVSSVSHELRTPLTIVKAALSNLVDGTVGPLEKKQAHVIETAKRNIDRLATLVNDLLDLSRLESGQLALHRERVHIGMTLERVLPMFHKEANEQGVLLLVDVIPGLRDLYVDPSMFHQTIMNLMSNAVRYADSRVVIKARMLDEAHAQITITDDGPGLDKENMGRLFSKFEQINRPIGGSGYGGTGLGLAISRKVVERNGGKIWVESSVGRGSSFYFTMPFYDEDIRLNDLIKYAGRNGDDDHYAAIAAIAINNMGDLMKQCDQKSIDAMMQWFQETLQENVLRSDDPLVRYNARCFVTVIRRGNNRTLLSLNSRIQKLGQVLFCQGMHGKSDVDIGVGLAICGDESDDWAKLAAMAFSDCTRYSGLKIVGAR
jgi:excisionase family DNA binding protein